MKHKPDSSRRRFLKRAGIFPLLRFSTLLSASGAMSSLAAAPGDNAKSLVCIFLLGGADSFNFVVPGGPEYSEYLATRGSMAVTENELLAARDATLGEFGFHHLLPGLLQLY